METKQKDPGDIVDFGCDWSEQMAEDSDTITASIWVVPTGLTVDDATQFNTTATLLWVSGGTPGRTYTVTNRVTTAGGRTFERSGKIKVSNL